MRKINVNRAYFNCPTKYFSPKQKFCMVCLDLKNSRGMSDVKRYVAQKRLIKLLENFKRKGYKVNLYDGKDAGYLIQGDAIAVACPVKNTNDECRFQQAVLYDALKTMRNIEFRSCCGYCDSFDYWSINSARKVFGILQEALKLDR